MNALDRFDKAMRERAVVRFREFDRELAGVLTRFAVTDSIDRLKKARRLQEVDSMNEEREIDQLTAELTPEFGAVLSQNPTSVDAIQLTQRIIRRLADQGRLRTEPAEALILKEPFLIRAVDRTLEALGADRKSFAGEVLRAVALRRQSLWRDRVHHLNWELFDYGVETFTRAAVDEIAKSGDARGLLGGASKGNDLRNLATQSTEDLKALQKDLEKPFAGRLFLERRQGGLGPKGDLVKEMHSVLQVPGWTNIWTQPIANRIDMLSTGVRTPIGVKVFGPDLETIDRTCKDIEAALKAVPGAQYVLAEPIMGKGYLEITIDRQRAARYGIQVGDIQDTIEVALGGRMITQTVEGRDRFPVRIRYARDFREDEGAVRHLLISPGMNRGPAMPSVGEEGRAASVYLAPGSEGLHETAPEHAAGGRPRLQIPLGSRRRPHRRGTSHDQK